jgi:hypothetical protein
MSKTGGSGIALRIKKRLRFSVFFDQCVILLPLAIGLALVPHLILPAHEHYRLKLLPYFRDFLALLLIVYGAAAPASLFSPGIREKLGFKAVFHTCGFLALGGYNLITLKFELIPNIHFPAPERILAVFVEDGFFLLCCLVYSLRLLLCVVPVRTETPRNHPEVTAKFLRAVQKGAKFAHENPDETAQILFEIKRATGDPLANARLLKSFNYRASVSQALPALEHNAKAMQDIGILRADVNVDRLVRDVFVAVPGVPDSLF